MGLCMDHDGVFCEMASFILQTFFLWTSFTHSLLNLKEGVDEYKIESCNDDSSVGGGRPLDTIGIN